MGEKRKATGKAPKRAGDGAGQAADLGARLYCSQRAPARQAFEGVMPGPRLEAILSNSRQWANGTRLRVFFYADRRRHGRLAGSGEDIAVARAAFSAWKELGIGLDFEETADIAQAELRVAFRRGDGSWSYVGRDALHFPQPDEPTMNFGWALTTPLGEDTALHEVGHAIGMNHEHQNPNAGIVWDEEAVIRRFSGPPNNWDLATIRHNILSKLDPNDVSGSSWDKDSIMHYAFEAGLIHFPEIYRNEPLIPAPGFSKQDREWARRYYPPGPRPARKLAVAASRPVAAGYPGQDDFVFEPTETRRYSVGLFGVGDCVLLLAERGADGDRFLAGDDCTGRPEAAGLKARLEAGKRYVVKVKVHWRPDKAPLCVLLW